MRYLPVFLLLMLCVFRSAEAASQQQKLEQLKKKILEEKKQIELLTKKEELISLNITQINERLSLIKKKISDTEQAKKFLEGELVVLYRENERLNAQLAVKKGEIEKRLIIWQKTYLLQRRSLFVDFDETILFENYMKSIFNYDKILIENLVQDKNTLQKNLDEIQTKKAEIEGIEENLKERKRAQEILEKRQKQLLSKTERQKNLHAKKLKKAEEALKKLEELIKKAETMPEYKGRGLSKKTLPYPVKGKIVGHFGTEGGAVKGSTFKRKGVEIETVDGEPVKSVDSGKIVYTGWLRGLGNVCIISHGKNFYTVYGRMSSLKKNEGENVTQGEIIGLVGQEASFYNFPTLYFEVREKGNVLNPELMLK